MKALGIKLTDVVVCYDTAPDQQFGYRAAWMFQAFGHPKTVVLDGGFMKWKSEDRPIQKSE